MRRNELRAQLVVIGATAGGVAAALAALDRGTSVILAEESGWLGGVLTSQLAPPGEHPLMARFGSTESYRRFQEGVRAYYRHWYRGPEEAGPSGSRQPACLSYEPRVGVAVLEALFAPYCASGVAQILRHHEIVGGTGDGDRIEAVTIRDRGGAETTLVAEYFLDASDTGALLDVLGIEHVTGSEAAARTGEPHAGSAHRVENHQAFSVQFAVDHFPGADFTIDRPPSYARWSDVLAEGYGGGAPWSALLEPTGTAPDGREQGCEIAGRNGANWWAGPSRAVVVRGGLTARAGDAVFAPWSPLDYRLGSLLVARRETRQQHLEGAKALSLSVLYWLQTTAPRPDGGVGWPGLRLRSDIAETADGLARTPFVHESRRIEALYTIVEQDLTRAARGAAGAARYPDSVGIGASPIVLHPTILGDDYLELETWPFQLPLRALVPVRVENLLPASKNIGTTHLTAGCYCGHAIEWTIGEVAGCLAAHCLRRKVTPHGVATEERLGEAFRGELMSVGFPLQWPDVRGY